MGVFRRGEGGEVSPPWINEIYEFQRVFRPQRIHSPPRKKKYVTLPSGHISEYVPESPEWSV